MQVEVTLIGCDDTTEFYVYLDSEEQLVLLEKLAKTSQETSTYQCMPILEYKIMEENNV